MLFSLFFTVLALVKSSAFLADALVSDCQPGTYITATGCAPCPRLKFSTTVNSRFCRRCPPSQEATPDRTSCIPILCPIGYHLPSGKVKCRPCPENSYSTTANATECTPCPPNTASLRAATSPADCITCPIGKVVYRHYDFNDIGCTSCTHFRSTFTVSSEKCVPCIPGTFRNRHNQLDGRCFPCRAGYRAPHSGMRNCYKCRAGTYQPAQGATSCLPCPPASISHNSRRYCKPTCTLGSPGCVRCTAGQGYNVQTKICESCPPGSVSPGNVVTECIPCRGGSRPNEEQSRCLCAPGFTYLIASESCVKCPAGTSNTNGAKCNLCVLEGRSSVGCVCPPLTQNVDPITKNLNNKCVPCTPNYSNRKTCRRCELNEIVDEVRGTCVTCPPDTWSDGPGEKTCKPCLFDTKRRADARYCDCIERNHGVINGKCAMCPVGQQRSYDSIRKVPTCRECFPGTFNDKPGGVCQHCLLGFRPPGFGNTKCLDACPPRQERREGVSADEGECMCKDKFEPVMENGILTCVACKQGEVVWNDKCVCQSGTYSEPDDSICEPCPENHYPFGTRCRCRGGWVPKDGGCEPCPAGTFEDFEKCEVCRPGSVTLEPGNSWCYRCPRGMIPDGPAKCVEA